VPGNWWRYGIFGSLALVGKCTPQDKQSHEHYSNQMPTEVIADKIKRYKAGRVIEFLSTCPEFEDLQENNFLEMNFADLTEFFCMQIGWESLEAAYEHYVRHEPYALATLNSEFERLRLGAIAGGARAHNAILAHLAAFTTSKSG
jgi:hypothetical protein